MRNNIRKRVFACLGILWCFGFYVHADPKSSVQLNTEYKQLLEDIRTFRQSEKGHSDLQALYNQAETLATDMQKSGRRGDHYRIERGILTPLKAILTVGNTLRSCDLDPSADVLAQQTSSQFLITRRNSDFYDGQTTCDIDTGEETIVVLSDHLKKISEAFKKGENPQKSKPGLTLKELRDKIAEKIKSNLLKTSVAIHHHYISPIKAPKDFDLTLKDIAQKTYTIDFDPKTTVVPFSLYHDLDEIIDTDVLNDTQRAFHKQETIRILNEQFDSIGKAYAKERAYDFLTDRLGNISQETNGSSRNPFQNREVPGTGEVIKSYLNSKGISVWKKESPWAYLSRSPRPEDVSENAQQKRREDVVRAFYTLLEETLPENEHALTLAQEFVNALDQEIALYQKRKMNKATHVLSEDDFRQILENATRAVKMPSQEESLLDYAISRRNKMLSKKGKLHRFLKTSVPEVSSPSFKEALQFGITSPLTEEDFETAMKENVRKSLILIKELPTYFEGTDDESMIRQVMQALKYTPSIVAEILLEEGPYTASLLCNIRNQSWALQEKKEAYDKAWQNIEIQLSNLAIAAIPIGLAALPIGIVGGAALMAKTAAVATTAATVVGAGILAAGSQQTYEDIHTYLDVQTTSQFAQNHGENMDEETLSDLKKQEEEALNDAVLSSGKTAVEAVFTAAVGAKALTNLRALRTTKRSAPVTPQPKSIDIAPKSTPARPAKKQMFSPEEIENLEKRIDVLKNRSGLSGDQLIGLRRLLAEAHTRDGAVAGEATKILVQRIEAQLTNGGIGKYEKLFKTAAGEKNFNQLNKLLQQALGDAVQ